MAGVLMGLAAMSPAVAATPEPDPECALHPGPDARMVEVAQVIDGDTVVLAHGERVRFLGINTPEIDHNKKANADKKQQTAHRAKRALMRLLADDPFVHISPGQEPKDAHGRSLAFVSLRNGVNLSAHLVAEGLGFAISIDPNTRLSDCLLGLERRAEAGGLGLWAAPEHWINTPKDLNRGKGFAVVRGRPTGLYYGKNSTWIEFGDKFSARISKKTRNKYPSMNYQSFEQLGAQAFEVRGWLFKSRGRDRLQLSTPYMIRALNNTQP